MVIKLRSEKIRPYETMSLCWDTSGVNAAIRMANSIDDLPQTNVSKAWTIGRQKLELKLVHLVWDFFGKFFQPTVSGLSLLYEI